MIGKDVVNYKNGPRDKDYAAMGVIKKYLSDSKYAEAGMLIDQYGIRMFISHYYEYLRYEKVEREDANRLYREALRCWASNKKEYEQPDLFKGV